MDIQLQERFIENHEEAIAYLDEFINNYLEDGDLGYFTVGLYNFNEFIHLPYGHHAKRTEIVNAFKNLSYAILVHEGCSDNKLKEQYRRMILRAFNELAVGVAKNN